MFACALYPATPEFLANVRQEARHQVKRLQNHACLALWCGNNEDGGALNWFKEAKENRDRYLVDYDRLNEGVLGATVDECDPTRTFWPSSPCGGRGDYSDCWHADNRGDMHYWSVWHEGKSFDAYYTVTPRFCSEFGYQSFPALDTIQHYAPRDQFNVTSPVMEWHQRNPGGNSRITEMFSRYFRMPEGFPNFVYLSQVQQALAIKIAVEHWRHLRPTCMGTLYWQLNDNWPVCSWASVEHGGKWKLLHYAAKKFYAPVLVSAFQKSDKVEIWVTNDALTPARGEVVAEIRTFAGKLVRRQRWPANVGAGAAKLIQKLNLLDLVGVASSPRPAGKSRRGRRSHIQLDQVFLQLTFNGATNSHFFTEYKRCELAKPKIRVQVQKNYRITLRTDRPAFFVSLNAIGIRGEFDDNCVTLLPGKAQTFRFTSKQPVTLAAFKKSLILNHLRGTYA